MAQPNQPSVAQERFGRSSGRLTASQVIETCATILAGVILLGLAWTNPQPYAPVDLIAGLSGAAIAIQGGIGGINMGEWVKVLYGLVASLLFGFAVGWLVCKAVTLICAGMDRRRTNGFFTYAQIVGAAAMSFMHGAQDGQKFIGVLFLGMAFCNGQPSVTGVMIPIWLMILCSTIMGVGTSVGGERIIKSVGQDMVKLEKYQGFSADLSSALCLLVMTVLGIPVSTTHTKTSAIMGVGAAKRLSAVKGGRFARHCAPAQVFAVVLSDILGDPLDMIASGPAYPDSSSCAQALDIAKRYGLRLSEWAWALLAQETPKTLENVETQITGSVRELCAAAAAACEALGYEPMILTDCLCCEAREAGSMLASIARTHARDGKNLAFLMGGETVVHLRGKGLGGRNQEIALSAGLSNALVFSVGSDGTDGPTDAAGGIADGETAQLMRQKGVDAVQSLNDNDAYHALDAVGGLIKTGATGTNVNDVSILLLRAAE